LSGDEGGLGEVLASGEKALGQYDHHKDVSDRSMLSPPASVARTDNIQGVGSIARWEGFGIDYFLPQSTDEGGCYSETCAAIGVCMLAERLLHVLLLPASL
jgi:hypothetical protein